MSHLDDDRTVIRPRPGGRRPEPPPATLNQSVTVNSDPVVPMGKLNPLESAASALLALLARLNQSPTHHDPDALKQKISREIRVFQERAQASGLDTESVYTARYILCTILDEAVLNTPWGQDSEWAQSSLLSNFHKEVSGGERFFTLLKSLAQNPAKNLHLLELMYICLSLGFEGRYRIVDGGKDKLARIREWLFSIIQRQTGSVDQTLSPHSEGVKNLRNPLLGYVPLWVIAAIALGLLGAAYSAFVMNLNKLSDPVFRQISLISVAELARPEPVKNIILKPIPLKEPTVTLSLLLENEIAAHKLNVNETDESEIVTIQGDGLFGSGVDTVKKELQPLLETVAMALNQLPGRIHITGHSDNVPIRSLRFPSNWDLSRARAESVAKISKQFIDEDDRITTEGKADLEPLVPNTSRKGRATNRRVEIVLYK